MLDFDVGYFEEETRNGFTIPSFMKHAWAAQLEMLAKVDQICEDNDIKYFANWGTLLGTIRHRGYIPWDDDIDLCMFRSDLERFCQAVDNYDGITIQTSYNSPSHGFRACRVTNSELLTYERRAYKEYHGFPFPAGLDIFNLDYVPRDKQLEEEQVEALQVCATAAHTREWLDIHAPNDDGYGEQFHEYEAAVKWLEKNCGMQFSSEYPNFQEIVILHEEIAGLYDEENADYVTEVQCFAGGANYFIPKDFYATSIRLPFENTTIPVPIGYNTILMKKYGDSYMAPKNVAAGHDYPFYNTFIRAIYDEKRHKNFEGACEYIESISSNYYIKFMKKSTKPVLNVDDNVISGIKRKHAELSEEECKILAAQCEVLEEFKRLCGIIGISYFAIGTTLEACEDGDYSKVSNGINVAIKRDNLSQFLSILGQELNPWFNYSNLYYINEHEDMRIRIWSDSYMCDEEEFAERFHGCKDEVSLYISVIDKVATDKEQEDARKMLIKNLVVTSQTFPSTPPYSEEVLGIVDEWNKILQTDINVEMNLKREFLRVADNMSGAVIDSDSKWVRINSDIQEGIDEEYPVSYYEDFEEVKFFITTISVPKK